MRSQQTNLDKIQEIQAIFLVHLIFHSNQALPLKQNNFQEFLCHHNHINSYALSLLATLGSSVNTG